MPNMTLIRGLPGSGKSTLAKKLAQGSGMHVEADQYFYDQNGVYQFVPSKLNAAHKSCRDRTRAALEEGIDVFVSNTFTMLWELEEYLAMAAEFGINPQIIICQGDFKSIHGVPDEKLALMKSRFKYDLDGK
jgi:predicted kinase